MTCRSPHRLQAERVPTVILSLFAILLSVCGVTSDEISLLSILHNSVLFFFLLLLSQRNFLLAYILLPLTIVERCCFCILYDFAGIFLHTSSLPDLIATARISQHQLRIIYDITPGACLLYASKIVLLYGLIFCIRRYLYPVKLFNDSLTWIIAVLYTFASLLIVQFGII